MSNVLLSELEVKLKKIEIYFPSRNCPNWKRYVTTFHNLKKSTANSYGYSVEKFQQINRGPIALGT